MSDTKTINAYAVFEAGGEFKPFQYDVAEPQANEVEIDVLHCGICHSDMSMTENEWGMSQYPLVAGHEVIGKIAAKGADVKNMAVGTLVGLGWHSGYCGYCHSCKTGDQNLCASAQGTIIAHHGGFAEKVRAQASSVVAIPEGIDPATAGPLLCAGITVFNPIVQFGIKSTDKVAVIGIGGLGHLALQFLNAWGCEVTAFTSSDSKRQEALELGAHKILNSRDSAEIETAANSFDFIISTVNISLDWNLYLGTLKPKGRLHFVGAVTDSLDLSVFPMLMAQRSVSASPVGSPATIESMLDLPACTILNRRLKTFP